MPKHRAITEEEPGRILAAMADLNAQAADVSTRLHADVAALALLHRQMAELVVRWCTTSGHLERDGVAPRLHPYGARRSPAPRAGRRCSENCGQIAFRGPWVTWGYWSRSLARIRGFVQRSPEPSLDRGSDARVRTPW
jgi:acyl-CoA synthetase (AMP-forming)/AMP-acid ligase II